MIYMPEWWNWQTRGTLKVDTKFIIIVYTCKFHKYIIQQNIDMKLTKEIIESNISNCFSFTEMCRRVGLKPNGGNITRIRFKMEELGIDFSHFTGQGWNKLGHPSFGNSGKTIDEFFTENSDAPSSKVKTRLLKNEIKEYKCECCGITEWNGKDIILELHHINGNHRDNRIENLQLLCPNCHSQTHNYCKRKELLFT